MSSMKNVKSVKLTSSLAVLNEPTPPWRGILCVKGALTNDQYLVTSTTGHLLVILYWQRFFRNEEGVYRWIYYFDCDGSERTLNECKIRSVRENRDTCVKVMNVKCYNKTGESQESRNQTSLPTLSDLSFHDTKSWCFQCIILIDHIKHPMLGKNKPNIAPIAPIAKA